MSRQILIIPDVHGRTFWKEPVRNIDKYEKVIFLGDYLDPYPSEGISIEDAIKIFKEIIALKEKYPEKVILLLGNHDVHYLWFKEAAFATRFSFAKVVDIMGLFHFNKELFSIVHSEFVVDKTYLFSHAGINRKWLKYNNLELPLTGVDSFLKGLYDNAEGRTMLFQIGTSRGGKNPSSGLVWADYIFDMGAGKENIGDNYYQIVGHTRSFNERRIGSHAACLDCKKAWVLDCLTGKLEVVV